MTKEQHDSPFEDELWNQELANDPPSSIRAKDAHEDIPYHQQFFKLVGIALLFHDPRSKEDRRNVEDCGNQEKWQGDEGNKRIPPREPQ